MTPKVPAPARPGILDRVAAYQRDFRAVSAEVAKSVDDLCEEMIRVVRAATD